MREAFRKGTWGFGNRGLVCPACFDPEYTDGSATAGYGVLFAALGVWFLERDGSWFGIGRFALWFVLAPFLVLVAHELTHALAGRLAGIPIYEVRFGWKEPFASFRLGGLRVGVARDFLRRGYCVGGDPRTRWRAAFFTGAPLLLHLACVAAALPFAFAPGPYALAAHFLILWNGISFFFAAWPATEDTFASDGAHLLELRRDPEGYLAKVRQAASFLPAVYALRDKDPEDARRHLEEILARGESPEAREMLWGVHYSAGRWDDALACAAALAWPDAEPAEARAAALEGEPLGPGRATYLKGTTLLAAGRRTEAITELSRALEAETLRERRPVWLSDLGLALLLEPADREEARRGYEAAREAFEHLPWVDYVQITMALAHFEMGEADAARALLASPRVGEGRETEFRIVQALLDRDEKSAREILRGSEGFPALRRKLERACLAEAPEGR